MDNVVYESRWMDQKGVGGRVRYRIAESTITHLFYVDKANYNNPTYYRRISKGYPTVFEATAKLNELTRSETMERKKSSDAKPKMKKRCKCK